MSDHAMAAIPRPFLGLLPLHDAPPRQDAPGAGGFWQTSLQVIDPGDPRNDGITDLALAPRNATGKVEYSMDVYLLKPVDMSRASGRLF